MPSPGDETLAGFTALVAATDPAPAGGACAAVACALAAGLVQMTAGLTPGADDAARRAGEIRAAALVLADRDGGAYAAVIEARRLAPGPDRDRRVAAALSHAADVPLQIAELGAEAGRLAAELQRAGNPNLAGDAAVAVALARAATTGAAALVAINLEDRPHDPRVERARELAR